MICEKCWGDAYIAMLALGGTQVDHYKRYLKLRRKSPCAANDQRTWYRDRTGPGHKARRHA